MNPLAEILYRCKTTGMGLEFEVDVLLARIFGYE